MVKTMDNWDGFEGKNVVTTGLDVRDEQFVKKNVEARGGTFKPGFVKSLDMLVFNPQYYKETVKMRNTKDLIDKGYPVVMVTFDEFCKMVSGSNGLEDQSNMVSKGFHMESGVLVKYVEVTDDSEITIPKTVHKIGGRAFKDCKKIKKVILQEGMLCVDAFSFAGCSSLEEVVLPEGLKEIGNAAFGDCNNLKTINIPDTLEKLGPQVFAGCFALERIRLPELITEIDWNMFLACESLEEIIIEGNITKIEKMAFSGCKSLKEFTLPAALNTICEETFKDCESLTEIHIHEGIRAVESRAFSGCTSLKSISMNPDTTNIKRIGAEAFRDCTSLKKIELPRLMRTVSKGLLENCISLRELVIPYGVTRIEENAFSGCTSIQHIDLPETVEVIDASAFNELPDDAFNNYGNGLYLGQKGNPYYWFIMPEDNSARMVEVSSDTVKMANNSLSECGPFREIIIPKNIQKMTSSVGTGVKRITIYNNLQNVLKSVLDVYGEFSLEIAVKSVDTGEILRVIPAFGCDNSVIRSAWGQGNEFDFAAFDRKFDEIKGKDKKVRISVARLLHPTGLTDRYEKEYLSFLNANSKSVIMQAIDDDDIDLITFMGNNGLIKKVSIKSYIAEASKRNAVAITAYLLQYTNQPKDSIPKPPKATPKPPKRKEPSLSKWEFREKADQTFEITKYKGGSADKILIPDTYKGKRITSIGEDAFSAQRAKTCAGIEEIVIPESITCIGNRAFYHCTKLKELTLPPSLVSIGKEAFVACEKIKNFDLPESVKEIGYGAFADCSGINAFTFPMQVKEVPGKVLEGCVQLEEVKLSSSASKIGKDAFMGCKKLKKVDLPETVETIESFAFYGCSALESIVFPEGLRTIETLAFKGCEALETVFIPKHASLDNSVGSPFEECTSLFEVTADSNSEFYTSIDGVLFDKDVKTIVRYPNAKGNSYTVPDGVEIIGKAAFSVCKDLQSVIIPDSVRNIEDGAFKGCRSLNHVTLSRELETIGKEAFRLCGLTEIDLPESLKAINEKAFSTCKLICIEIPEGTNEIGYNAFFQNRELEKVILPASITKIGKSFFGSDVFDLCFKVKVYAPAGSEAERYCKEKGIPLVESPDSF